MGMTNFGENDVDVVVASVLELRARVSFRGSVSAVSTSMPAARFSSRSATSSCLIMLLGAAGPKVHFGVLP